MSAATPLSCPSYRPYPMYYWPPQVYNRSLGHQSLVYYKVVSSVPYSLPKIAISRLEKRSYSCVPTAKWVPRNEGEKLKCRGRIKVGKYIFHAVLSPKTK